MVGEALGNEEMEGATERDGLEEGVKVGCAMGEEETEGATESVGLVVGEVPSGLGVGLGVGVGFLVGEPGSTGD